MTRTPRIAWVVAAVAAPVLAAAPVAAAAPEPCGGAPQITDPVGDGHHQNSDVTSAWFSGAPQAMQAVIRTRVGLFEPAHDDSAEMGLAMVFRIGEAWRYVRARADRAGAIAYDAGTWSPTAAFQPEGPATGSTAIEAGTGVVTIGIPSWFGLTPATIIANPFAITNDGSTAGVPHWVDRAPGGTTPDGIEYGADLLVGTCDGSQGMAGVAGVTLAAPARLIGGGMARVAGVVAGAGAGLPVTISATGRSVVTVTTRTDGTGAFTARVPIAATTSIRATAAGLGSPTVRVIARERVTVRRAVSAGARMTATVAPALPGKAVLVRPGGFAPLATARVRGGRAAFVVPVSAVGRAQVVIIPDGDLAERGQSTTFRIQ